MENPIKLKELTIEVENKEIADKLVKVIKFIGKISNDNGFELNKRFSDFFSDKNYNMILDLTNLNYINSTGIAIIFSMFFKCKDYQGKLVIGGVHEFVKKVLSMMTLPDDFKIYNSTEEALNIF
ncbi:MAG: STAS domain-containing protein [Leptonema sp. (in: bacteria)]